MTLKKTLMLLLLLSTTVVLLIGCSNFTKGKEVFDQFIDSNQSGESGESEPSEIDVTSESSEPSEIELNGSDNGQGNEMSDETIENPLFSTEKTEVEDFPDLVPLPNEYIVVVDTGGENNRNIVLEVSEDIATLIDEFNDYLSSNGINERIDLMDDEDEEEDRLMGIVSYMTKDELFVTITIGEYGEGGALEEGNVGAVTYRFNQ